MQNHDPEKFGVTEAGLGLRRRVPKICDAFLPYRNKPDQPLFFLINFGNPGSSRLFKMPDDTETSDSQINDRLKSTLWYHIGQLVDEETINLGVNATPQYIGSLTELVWAQIGEPRSSGKSEVSQN